MENIVIFIVFRKISNLTECYRVGEDSLQKAKNILKQKDIIRKEGGKV